MKKLTLLFAALVLSFTAQAAIINGTPNPGEKGRLNWWVNGVVESIPVTQPGDTIVLADGEYEEGSIEFNKEGLVVMAAEGAKPVIKASSYMQHYATTTFIGITFDGQDVAEYTTYSYKTDTEKDLAFINCEFKNYTKSCVTIGDGEANVRNLLVDGCTFDGGSKTPAAIKSSGIISACDIKDSEIKGYTEYGFVANSSSAHTDELSVDNTIIHDCGYSAIHVKAAADGKEKQSCSSFELTNSTIYNIGDNTKDYGAIDIRDNANIASTQQVLIDHVTLYNFTTIDWYGGFMILQSANATISNCIAMNPADIYTLWINPYHIYAGATISNSMNFNCGYIDNGATKSGLVKADPMFVDAANADFMLYAESPAVGAGTDGSNLGDPRWGVKAGLKPGAEVLSKAVAAAAPGATITLGDGIYEESSSFDFDKEGLTIVAAEGTKPVIKLTGEWTSLELSASTTFDGITFDGNNITKYPVTSTGTNASTYIFTNCEFKNYVTYAISNPYSGGTYAESVVIDNCLFHDGGAAVCFNKRGYNGNAACNSFKMTNTTIYNVTCSEWVGIIHIASNEEAADAQNEVIIDHITMYNFTPNELGGITSRFSENVSITNSIFANPTTNANQYAFRVSGASEVKNTLYHNARIEGTPTNPINADPLFVNAAENNFQLYANSPAVGAGTDGSTLGDPRWGVSASLKGKVINIEPGEKILAAAVGYSVSPGDTIVLADGTYDEPYGFDFNVEGLVVMAAEGATPVVELSDAGGWTTFTLSATTTFDGIIFDGKAVCKYMLQTNATDISKLAFYNCEFRNYANYAISNPDAGGTHVDSVIIDNCLFHDGAGSAVNFNNKGYNGDHACSYFKLTNSSVYNIGSAANAAITIRANGDATGAQNTVIIDHITLYNYATSEYGGIAIRKTNDLQITNSIIANPSGTLYAIYHYSEVQNNLFHNVTLKASDGAAYNAACITADPLFVDAANNNFMLQANSPAIGKATDGSNLGDPRWGVEGPQVITLTTGDNSQVIADNINKTVNVKIMREFKAGVGYYTLCVPFNMPASVIGKAYSLGTITKHVTGEGININLTKVDNIEAGVPYLIEPNITVDELLVENVTIVNTEGSNYTVTGEGVKVTFTGIINGVGETTNNSTEYYVGNGGYLYNGTVEKLGLCGLFTITDEAGNPTKVRARVVTREDAATGLDNNQLPITNIQKAIENGQLIIIRDGVKYNVQGQKL